ncbi:hypothetical protein KQX54_015480 [Cotesia glomerata]|uniref:Uncharacterized protein n=1 Tax=Cotesia glomerata TaxID=32391 RepID=A0AAV7IMU1_COTGL|nr:hypothetical protein KQX54_015480 [Cotesia glomerata]
MEGEGDEGSEGKAKIEENVLLRKFGCNGTEVNENIGLLPLKSDKHQLRDRIIYGIAMEVILVLLGFTKSHKIVYSVFSLQIFNPPVANL